MLWSRHHGNTSESYCYFCKENSFPLMLKEQVFLGNTINTEPSDNRVHMHQHFAVKMCWHDFLSGQKPWRLLQQDSIIEYKSEWMLVNSTTPHRILKTHCDSIPSKSNVHLLLFSITGWKYYILLRLHSDTNIIFCDPNLWCFCNA